MALKKTITDSTGRTAEYWKIVQSQSFFMTEVKTHFNVALYASAEARLNGFQPVSESVYVAEGELSRAQCYYYLKTLEQFEEAEDV